MGLEDEGEGVGVGVGVGVECEKNDIRKETISPGDLPYGGWRGKSLSPAACAKVSNILVTCKEGGEPDALGALATSVGGLVDDEVRRAACMSMASLEDV